MESGGSPLRFDVATPWVWGGWFLEENYERILPFREKGVNLPTGPAANLIKGAMLHDIREKLPRVQAPTLVIVGEDDLLTPPKLSSYIAERVQQGQLRVMQRLGHAAALEDVNEFSGIVLDFFKRIEGGE
jgi:3-oxoadipate enol-lactonase